MQTVGVGILGCTGGEVVAKIEMSEFQSMSIGCVFIRALDIPIGKEKGERCREAVVGDSFTI